MGAIGLITPPIVGAHITVGTDEEEEEEAIRPFSLSLVRSCESPQMMSTDISSSSFRD